VEPAMSRNKVHFKETVAVDIQDLLNLYDATISTFEDSEELWNFFHKYKVREVFESYNPTEDGWVKKDG
jgi:hypothetical protein